MSKQEVIIEPSLDERILEGYYFQEFSCRNCGNRGSRTHVDVMIPVGRLRPEKLPCPNCEVEELQ